MVRIPPNLQFIVDDVNEEWSFPADSFDFIHVRGLAGSLTDWPQFLKRCYKYADTPPLYSLPHTETAIDNLNQIGI